MEGGDWQICKIILNACLVTHYDASLMIYGAVTIINRNNGRYELVKSGNALTIYFVDNVTLFKEKIKCVEIKRSIKDEDEYADGESQNNKIKSATRYVYTDDDYKVVHPRGFRSYDCTVSDELEIKTATAKESKEMHRKSANSDRTWTDDDGNMYLLACMVIKYSAFAIFKVFEDENRIELVKILSVLKE